MVREGLQLAIRTMPSLPLHGSPGSSIHSHPEAVLFPNNTFRSKETRLMCIRLLCLEAPYPRRANISFSIPQKCFQNHTWDTLIAIYMLSNTQRMLKHGVFIIYRELLYFFTDQIQFTTQGWIFVSSVAQKHVDFLSCIRIFRRAELQNKLSSCSSGGILQTFCLYQK